MKKKEFKELRTKSIKDLKKMAFAKKLEAERVKINRLAGKEKNLKLGKNLRQEIAKILTLIREKEILESIEAKAEAAKEVKEVKKK